TIIGALLGLQIVWGAFVAGLRAGKIYPTFPLMGGRLVPAGMITREPALLNLIATPVAVQWVHRLIGTLLAVAVVATFVVVMRRVRDRIARRYGGALLAMVIAQYGLGVATLLLL